MHRSLLLLVVGALFGVFGETRATSAQPEEISFRGLRFGVDLREQIPECSKGCLSFAPTQYCGRSEMPEKTCWESVGGIESFSVEFFDSLARDLVLYRGGAGQRDGKLVSLDFEFGTSEFPTLEALFRAKYGKPAASKEAPWQSKGGVRTKSQMRRWKWRGLLIQLQAPALKVDSGIATIKTVEAATAEQDRQKEQHRRNLKDL